MRTTATQFAPAHHCVGVMRVVEQIGDICMEKQQLDRELTNAAAPDAQQWVAPLQSMTSYSIAEFTQIDSNPGDDGLGVFTQS